MGSSKIAILILLIWSIHLGVAENIIISPLCVFNSPPSCVTLSQYISSNNRVAASLVLLPGVHLLISPLRVQNSEFVYLQGQGQSDQVTVSCNSSPSPDVEFVQVNEVAISNLVFVQCSVNITGSLSSTVSISYAEFRGSRIDRGLSIVGSNNVNISHSVFQNHRSNSYTVILYFSQINNLKLSHCIIRDIHAHRQFIEFRGIDKTEIFRCNFTNNTIMGYYSIVDIRQTTSAQISCCVFENNYIGPYASGLSFDGDTIGVTNTTFSHNTIDDYGNIVELHLSSIFGHISCCTFLNNSFIEDYSEVLLVRPGSIISISNSTFTLNRQIGGRNGRILFCYSSCTVISSVFKNNSVGYRGDMVWTIFGQTSIFASEFAHNSIGVDGDLIAGNAVIDCTLIFNNSFWDPLSHNNVVLRNSRTCKQLLVIGERAISTCSDFEVCRLPQVFTELEFTEYTVRESIGNENLALKVCAVAVDVAFPVQVSFNTTNGTARKNEDFLIRDGDGRIVEFLQLASQKHCFHVIILSDNEVEGNKQFTIQLTSGHPYVTVTGSEATVTIVEITDDITVTESEAIATSVEITDGITVTDDIIVTDSRAAVTCVEITDGITPNTTGMDNCVGTDMDTDIAIDAAGFSFISVIIMVTVTVLSCILTWMCGVACGAGISHHVMKSQQPVLIQEPNKELVAPIYEEVDIYTPRITVEQRNNYI